MRLGHYPAEKLNKEILNIVGKYLNVKDCKIFFFGSRVTNQGDEHSDIDIGIEGPKEIPREIMAHIQEDIEKLPTLYKIEVVDFANVSKDFREVALQKIEPIL